MSASRCDTLGERTVRCPSCGGPSRYATNNPYRPFCSGRCRHLDLGAWASESYRVSASDRSEDDVADGAPQGPQ